jgi:isoleucyl-tRNA synthetase
MPPLERYMLHRLWALDREVRDAYERYAFQEVTRALVDFCQTDLSSLFFDIRRDSLYTDAPQALRRRAARTVMDLAFERVTIWLAPLLPFTTEEAWTTRFPNGGSNALRVMPQTPEAWRNEAEAERWAKVDGLDAAEVFRTSAATLLADEGPADAFHLAEAPSVAVEPTRADGCKCLRCWRVLPEVTPPKMLCLRCDEAVEIWDATEGNVAA